MTRLLVSVRSAEEARLALDCGVDLIDIKEPERGALGAADASVWGEVLEVVKGGVPVSCALGELPGMSPRLAATVPAGMRYVKVGLAGALDQNDWESAWRDATTKRPVGCHLVGVIYADYVAARAPSPDSVLPAARRLGCHAILVDTFDKRAGDLFAHWRVDALAQFLEDARSEGLLTVVGGGLTWRSLSTVLDQPIDYVAVRGLACAGERTAGLDLEACRRLANLVHGRREASRV